MCTSRLADATADSPDAGAADDGTAADDGAELGAVCWATSSMIVLERSSLPRGIPRCQRPARLALLPVVFDRALDGVFRQHRAVDFYRRQVELRCDLAV